MGRLEESGGAAPGRPAARTYRRHDERQFFPHPPVRVDEHGFHVVCERRAQRGDGRDDGGDFLQDAEADQRVLVADQAHDGVSQRSVERVWAGLGGHVDAHLGGGWVHR